MALATVAALRDMLQIGALYDNADLQQCCDAADAIIENLLIQDVYGVTAWSLSDNVATLYFQTEHGFIDGQTITVDGVHAHVNGSKTITNHTVFTVSFAATHPDQDRVKILPHGKAGIVTDYSGNDNVVLAALMTAADIWQARSATNGQAMGIDGQISPYRMGVSIASRVKGLIGRYMSPGSMVG